MGYKPVYEQFSDKETSSTAFLQKWLHEKIDWSSDATYVNSDCSRVKDVYVLRSIYTIYTLYSRDLVINALQICSSEDSIQNHPS